MTFYRIVVCARAPFDEEAMREIVARVLEDVLTEKLAEIAGLAHGLVEPPSERALSAGPAHAPIRFRLARQRRGAWRCAPNRGDGRPS